MVRATTGEPVYRAFFAGWFAAENCVPSDQPPDYSTREERAAFLEGWMAYVRGRRAIEARRRTRRESLKRRIALLATPPTAPE